MTDKYFKCYNWLGQKKYPHKILTKNRVRKLVSSEDNKNLRLWSVFKFRGNVAWYAVCPTCGYNYYCSTFKQDKDENGVGENEVTKLYRFCPDCGQRFNLKEYVDYTDINLPAIEGYSTLVEILKAYNYFDSIEDKDEREKALNEEYSRQWKAYYGNMEED